MRVIGWLLLSLLLAACSMQQGALTGADKAPEFRKSSWQALPEWRHVQLSSSLDALRQGCVSLANRDEWQQVCAEAALLDAENSDGLHRFFESHFTPYQLRNGDGSAEGLITGYYEPLLYGSREKSERFRYPVFGVPDDLMIVDLSNLYPQLKGMRLRGRIEGRRIVPYYDRADIDAGHAPADKVLLWVDDDISLFFLQVQGSGRVELPDGSIVKLGYADQNGHPYASIGKTLIDMGEMTLEQVTLQSIRQWGLDHPDRLATLLNSNPSYVFFREMPDALQSAVGAMGVPLTAGYSMAVDKRVIGLGMPVFLATTWPGTEEPLHRLMLAQDTGGAIKGTIRGDFFWGFGEEAGKQAGKMKQKGRMWVLFPGGLKPQTLAIKH
ncbi:MAG: transglycosylase [Zetaproteobacteria bacterium CG12_big_fil_rev_8_21_14_0_65_54_13]|nr:MAG: transglycosylase [Zetaproteobacteria bacterium CG23_combo_of_CG06-09_8_20_14_all_54_7]PIW49149.1 MAG: transglycosylase [Zetaproteobacteria bacterium CG12_big_fil_rev_8_21_14_0_65_54_13]PIX53379.1 MAG: transglycosylase [Zetaproteobacteria bacterium CG_4_10_14_3_um_filter_54_28]PJA29297.1 MAG: transglycosylase [Zetaproteobacteria bacterium CG_4_9_14_3_um_filter_54_145]